MTEYEDREKLSEEEIVKTIKKEIKEFREEDWRPCYMEMPTEDYQKIIDAMQGLLDLYEAEKEKNHKASGLIKKLEPTEDLYDIEKILNEHVPRID